MGRYDDACADRREHIDGWGDDNLDPRFIPHYDADDTLMVRLKDGRALVGRPAIGIGEFPMFWLVEPGRVSSTAVLDESTEILGRLVPGTTDMFEPLGDAPVPTPTESHSYFDD